MEGLLIPAIIYVIGVAFKSFFKEDDENTENKSPLLQTVNNTVKKIENNLNELSYNYKKQKHIEESKKEYIDEEYKKNIDQVISEIRIDDMEDKEIPKTLSEDIEQQENSDEGFNLFSDSDDLIKGIIMSEILNKPKSMRR
ncbi:hypothetical protein [Tepidibacter sp. Z1-5]|uniref:hypothetical protein n=1 Tax=Tepidibacter sp. Z1-5 TaxID=3134138 RepID=UPI0030BD6B59